MRRWIDSTNPPPSTWIVSSPSPFAILAGRMNRTQARPLSSGNTLIRVTSTPSTVTMAVALAPKSGPPVGDSMVTLALTSSPGPYEVLRKSSVFLMRGAS